VTKTTLAKITTVRLPNELLERLEASAKADTRSISSEITKRLHLSFEAGRTALRDEFAAKAMQGFLSGHVAHYGHDNHWPYQALASEAYDMADAMLKAREGSAT